MTRTITMKTIIASSCLLEHSLWGLILFCMSRKLKMTTIIAMFCHDFTGFTCHVSWCRRCPKIANVVPSHIISTFVHCDHRKHAPPKPLSFRFRYCCFLMLQCRPICYQSLPKWPQGCEGRPREDAFFGPCVKTFSKTLTRTMRDTS